MPFLKKILSVALLGTVWFLAPAGTYEGIYPFAVLGYGHYSKKGLLHTGFNPGDEDKEFIPGA